jgi:hypothetical protein
MCCSCNRHVWPEYDLLLLNCTRVIIMLFAAPYLDTWTRYFCSVMSELTLRHPTRYRPVFLATTQCTIINHKSWHIDSVDGLSFCVRDAALVYSVECHLMSFRERIVYCNPFRHIGWNYTWLHTLWNDVIQLITTIISNFVFISMLSL